MNQSGKRGATETIHLTEQKELHAQEDEVAAPGETTEKGHYVDPSATFSQACRSSTRGHSRNASPCGRRRPATATEPQAPRQPR